MNFQRLFLFASFFVCPFLLYAQHTYDLGVYRNISLGFASESLDSPVSFFGHSFIVFHNDEFPEPNSIVLEFYGHINVSFVWLKILTIGTPGSFKFTRFTDKVHQYNFENRNVQIFPLVLNTKEKNKLIAIINKEFSNQATPYTFFKKNCSWYVDDIFHQSFDESFIKKFYSIPVKTVTLLKQNNKISQSYLLKSNQSIIEEMYLGMSWKDKKFVKKQTTQSFIESVFF